MMPVDRQRAAAYARTQAHITSELEKLESQLERLDQAHETQESAFALEVRRAEIERREFWLRRFHLSLGLGHGAALAAVASKVFDKDVEPTVVAGTWWALAAFSVGLVLAGLIPVTLYSDLRRAPWVLAGLSAVCFVGGLGVTLLAAAAKAKLI